MNEYLMRLMTWHGTIVCLPRMGDGILHVPLITKLKGPPALTIDPVFLSAMGRQIDHKNLGAIVVRPVPGGRGVSVSCYGRQLSAHPDRPEMAFDNLVVDQWETFLPITLRALAMLQHVLSNRWIIRSSRTVLPRRAVQLWPGFHFRFHDETLDLTNGLAQLLPTHEKAANDKPPALRMDRIIDPFEAVMASPRGSTLITTEAWPVRARQTAETIVLAVHRHLRGQEPEQAVFDQDTTLLMQNPGLAGLDELLERLTQVLSAAEPQATPDLIAAPNTEPLPAATSNLEHGWALRK